jgi:1,4-dihydroxy-2-naphthoyl-CoA hydrolase
MNNPMIWWGGKRPPLEPMTALGADSLPAHLGIEFVDCGDDWVRARMPVDHRTQQPFRRLHGGASVALAETIGSVAASYCLDRERFVAVGMEINANHIRPAYEGWVYANARPEALGRTTQVWSIRIEDEAGKLVCISRLTMAVIPVDRK